MKRAFVLGSLLALFARPAAAETDKPLPPLEDTPYASLFAGVGGPLGGSTLPFSFRRGAGFGLVVGWAFRWGLSAEIMGQYDDAEIQLADEDDAGAGVGEGRIGLLGAALRGAVGQGAVSAWGTLGVSFGGGTLDLEIEASDDPIVYEVDFGPSPTVGFGVDARIADNIRVGPLVRATWLTIARACEVQRDGFGFFSGGTRPPDDPGGGYDYYGDGYYYGDPPPEDPAQPARRVCDHASASDAVPAMLFLGLSLTYEVR